MSLPKISILITSYFEDSKRYLDLCVESVNNLYYPGELEKIIVTKPGYEPKYDGFITTFPNQEKFFPPVGLNHGIKTATGELFFILNDDTIVTKESLFNMLNVYQRLPHVGLLMPMSNDQQNRYQAFSGINPGPYRYENLIGNKQVLMNARSQYSGIVSYHETLCIYAFLMSKKIYETIGPFDENLIGQDDIDYTLRISRSGYANAITYDSVVYHFGGASADKTFTPEIREESFKRFNEKWASPNQLG